MVLNLHRQQIRWSWQAPFNLAIRDDLPRELSIPDRWPIVWYVPIRQSDSRAGSKPTGAAIVEGISDIRIIGIDEKRPPRIRKEPYIDLFFELSHKSPEDWCREFNSLLSHHPAKPSIDEKEGLYINGWVRTPDEVVALLDLLKEKVALCNRQYIARVEQSVRNAGEADLAMSRMETGEQGRLNKIVAGLDFEVDPE